MGVYFKSLNSTALVSPQYQSIDIPTITASPVIPAPPAVSRYDNSAAKIWWKLGDLSSPFTNSGSVGARSLAYDVGSNGEPTYGAAGLWAPDKSATFGSNTVSSFKLVQDDRTIVAGTATLWAWINLSGANANNVGYIVGMYESDDIFDFAVLNTNNIRVRLRTGFIGGIFRDTAGGYVTWNEPHLIVVTYLSSGNLTIYIDGVQRFQEFINGGPLSSSATSWWFIGAPKLGGGYNHAIGSYYECGYDNSIFDQTKVSAMWATKP